MYWGSILSDLQRGCPADDVVCTGTCQVCYVLVKLCVMCVEFWCVSSRSIQQCIAHTVGVGVHVCLCSCVTLVVNWKTTRVCLGKGEGQRWETVFGGSSRTLAIAVEPRVVVDSHSGVRRYAGTSSPCEVGTS
jgi:hypothetical protein